MDLIIEKSFGKLREVINPAPSYISKIAKEKDYLCANKKVIRVWADYGQYNENRITLLHNGNDESIIIDKFTFSNQIKDTHYFQLTNANADSHNFIVEGRDDNGRLFEADFHISDKEILPYIVYSIILIVELKDAKLAEKYWKVLCNDYWFTQNLLLEEKISFIIKIKKLSKNIVTKYPFIEYFFQTRLSELIEICKAELSEYDIL